MKLSILPLLVVVIPLLNFYLLVRFGNYSRRWNRLVNIVLINMFILICLVIAAFPAIVHGEVYSVRLGNWFRSGLFEVDWVFMVDSLTYIMLLVVLIISFLVHVYSTAYMAHDPHITRFISYLSLFTFFMLLLVTANNFIGLFLGWEGVGLCSYLLISFWFTRVQANKAAIKAMVVNRVSDLFFTIGILSIFYIFQAVDFATVFGLSVFFIKTTIIVCGQPVPVLTFASFLLFLGAMGKSAQIGLHTWLPDAMEGPTPVSALIHAATMVTAGVFLIVRCSPLFECAPTVLTFMVFIGASTSFMAATSGLLQNDLKKVIAYSTCSQLGYMIFVCGLSGYTSALFHLSTHAFFKALLFLSAGAVIHALSGEQDMRKFGGLMRVLPFTYAAFLVGSVALMGIPFLSGFYSKDFILEIVGGSHTISSNFAYLLGTVSAFFTSFYSFRLLYLTFYGEFRGGRVVLEQVYELPFRMAFVLLVLVIGSVFLGVVGRDLFIGPGTDFWNGAIPTASSFTFIQLTGEFTHVCLKLTPLVGALIAVFSVFYLYGRVFQTFNIPSVSTQYLFFYRFFSYKWGFDVVYNYFINKPILTGAYTLVFSLIDRGILELIGPTGAGRSSMFIGRLTTRIQTGQVQDYALFMFVVFYIICVVLLHCSF